MRNILVLGLFVGFFAVLGFGLVRSNSEILGGDLRLVDVAVPAFELGVVSGFERAHFGVGDMADGKVKMVQFFASWCAPCRAEHPILLSLADDYDLPIYGVVYRDSSANAARFLEGEGNPYYRLGMDGNGGVALSWGVSGIPESFIIDGEGRIRLHIPYGITPLLLERQILPLIEELRDEGNNIEGDGV